MDAHLFRRFCEAAGPLLLGSRIEKLQEAGPGLLVLSLYGNGQKRQFCLRHDRKEPFCFFAGSRLTAGAAPSAAVMRLRKYAVGWRIAAVVPQFCQRRLWLLLAGNAEKEGGALPAGTALWLLLDLREGASLHFQRPEVETGGARLPEGQAGTPLPPEPDSPLWPEPAQLPEALAHWRDWPVLSPALRRSLVHMEEPDQWALMEDLRAGGGDVFLYTQGGAPDVVRAVSAWPLPPELRPGLGEESGEDVLALVERAAASLVLGRLAEVAEAGRARPAQRRLRKLAKLLEKLDAEEARLKAMTSRQEDALALSANLWRWPADFRAEVVELASDESSVDAAPRRIRLDGRHTVRANMERLFHAARRGKRGLELLAPRREALLEEAASLRRALGEGGGALPAAAGEGASAPAAPVTPRLIPRELPKRVQAFVSDDGFLLLRGRDARGNQAVLRKAAPGDIWLHAEGGPGAHVVIRRAHAGQEVPERTLEQAGCLAACKSWRRDAASARILYAEARHVRPLRGAAPGTVRMDKILATREVTVDAELESRLVHS